MTLSISNGDGSIARDLYAMDNWAVYWCSGQLNGSAEELTCRVALEPGGTIDVFGFQLAAQPNPSVYTRTYGQSGVHRKSRFLSDELRFVANGIDDHAVTLSVFSPAISTSGDQT